MYKIVCKTYGLDFDYDDVIETSCETVCSGIANLYIAGLIREALNADNSNINYQIEQE